MSKKRELLRRALEHLEWCNEERYNEDLEADIRTYLANQETAEDEPVVVIDDNFGSKQIFKDIAPHSHVIDIHVRYCGAWYVFEGDWIKEALPRIKFNQIDNQGIKFTLESHKINDYTRPSPERKPMTPTEIDNAVLQLESDSNGRMISDGSFAEGIRYAEKHHGITEDHNEIPT